MADNDNISEKLTRAQGRELTLLRLREGPPERLALSPLGILEITFPRNMYLIAPSGRFLLKRMRNLRPSLILPPPKDFQ